MSRKIKSPKAVVPENGARDCFDTGAMGLLQIDLETPYQASLVAWVIRLRGLRRQGLSWDEISILTRSDMPSYGTQTDGDPSDAQCDE